MSGLDMKEPDFIDEYFSFLRRKTFWLILAFILFVGFSLLIRSLVPNRLPGGHVRFLGAYGPSNLEAGFELNSVGMAPIERFSTAKYSKIISKHFEDQTTGENYVVFAIKHDVAKRDFIILFNVAKTHSVFTSDEDKAFGGDVVLTPIALISWNDLKKLESAELFLSEIKPTGFPKGCEFKTFLGAGMTLKHQYLSARKCHSKATLMSISGEVRSAPRSLFVNITIREGQDEYWFGEKGQGEKNYSYFGSTTGLTLSKVPKTKSE